MITGNIIPELYALKNLFYTTVRILLYDKDDNEDGCGTGFFFHLHYLDENVQQARIELLITNKHVIKDVQKALLVLHLGPVKTGIPTGGTYELEIDDFESKFILHPDNDIDLCALDISTYLERIREKTGKAVHYQAFTYSHIPTTEDLEQLFPATDVLMVGYPESLWDEVNNLPIARKGIMASHPVFDFNGKSKGAADIATFPGSSGSPIMLYQNNQAKYGASSDLQFQLLGVLSEAGYRDAEGKMIRKTIPSKTALIPLTAMMIHLGYYIKAKELMAFEALFIS